MAHTQIPKYHLAPNFSISPAPNGPIELGSIINRLDKGTLDVINEDCRIVIPPAKLYCHHKKGFTASKSKMRNGEYGIWAQFVGVEGIGGELSFSHGTTKETTYSFKGEDTIYFSPTLDYIKASMNEDDVSGWVEGTDFEPVYMVTGLKIARGPSVKVKKGKTTGGKADLGIQEPGGLPVSVGPKINISIEDKSEEGWEDSEDFVVGIRVKKLVYKKAWWSTKRSQEINIRDHNKGATLLDTGAMGRKEESENDVLEIGCDEELNRKDELRDIDEEEEILWVVPKLKEV